MGLWPLLTTVKSIDASEVFLCQEKLALLKPSACQNTWKTDKSKIRQKLIPPKSHVQAKTITSMDGEGSPPRYSKEYTHGIDTMLIWTILQH